MHFFIFREKLFHFWFNPFFVRTYDTDMEDYNTLGENTNLSQDDYYPNLLHTGNGSTNSNANYEIIQPTGGLFKLTLNKSELDDAHKDKQHKLYSADFQVRYLIAMLKVLMVFIIIKGAVYISTLKQQ